MTAQSNLISDCDFKPYVNGEEISGPCERCGMPSSHSCHTPRPKADDIPAHVFADCLAVPPGEANPVTGQR